MPITAIPYSGAGSLFTMAASKPVVSGGLATVAAPIVSRYPLEAFRESEPAQPVVPLSKLITEERDYLGALALRVRPLAVPATPGAEKEIISSALKTITDRTSQLNKGLTAIAAGASNAKAAPGAPVRSQLPGKRLGQVDRDLPGNRTGQQLSDPTRAGLSLSELLAGKDPDTRIQFTPFRIRLWSRDKGGVIDKPELAGGLQDKTVAVGRYILRFRVPADSPMPFMAFQSRLPITISGKKAEIEKAKYDPEEKILTVQVNLLENPIPVLLLIAAAAGAIGLGGWGLSESFDSLDKVVVDSTQGIGKLALLAGVGYLIWRFIK